MFTTPGPFTFGWRPDYYTYPSWPSDSIVNVTYAPGVAPTIELEDTSDVAAWMLCEMLSTTLTVSNNQVSTNTCGPSAVLASLMDNKPAQAIKMALQIGWTGSFTGAGGVGIEHDDVCEFIFEQAPGIVVRGPYAARTGRGRARAGVRRLTTAPLVLFSPSRTTTQVQCYLPAGRGDITRVAIGRSAHTQRVPPLTHRQVGTE